MLIKNAEFKGDRKINNFCGFSTIWLRDAGLKITKANRHSC